MPPKLNRLSGNWVARGLLFFRAHGFGWEKDRGTFMKWNCLAFLILFMATAVAIPNTAETQDNDVKLGFYWSPATGDVHLYNVYVSVDYGSVTLIGTTPSAPTISNPYFITGKAGKTYRIQVEAQDIEGDKGPRSDWSEPVICAPGDVNYDGKVDLTDLITLSRDWLSENSPADIDDDGTAGESDLQLIQEYWEYIYKSNEKEE